jgi:hypothetical protein
MTAPESPVKRRFWTIYGVLAALGLLALLVMTTLTGEPAQLSMALKAGAAAEASQVYTGCQSYMAEYGALPQTSENYRLIKILCGDNPRKIEFISLKPRQLSPNGEDIDPWKTPFRITFDPDFKIHVISAGPDKIFGTPDDIANQ